MCVRERHAFKDGYDYGFDDAMKGRPMKKDRLSLLPRYLALGKNYQNSFMEGYNKGYMEGLKKKN